MIRIERAPEGLTLTIKPEGVSRYGGALFIGVWLCFWAVGETMALGVLASGAWALLTGQPRSIEPAPALGVGGFLLVWVTFWSFGGVMAMRELLRLLSSEDVLVAGANEIRIRRRRGPFWTTQTIPRQDVRAVSISPHHRMLMIDTARRSVDFAHVVAPSDEVDAVQALRTELGLTDTREGEAVLPAGWEETITPEGDRVLVRDIKQRKRQALAVAVVAAVFWTLALAFAWAATSGNSSLGAALALTAIAAIFAAGAWWLDAGRQEWKVGGQRVVVRRRWRGRLKELFVADRLELSLHTDSDGDVWFKLEAVSEGRRRMLSQAMNDPFEPRALGRWLAARSGVPYVEFDRRGVYARRDP